MDEADKAGDRTDIEVARTLEHMHHAAPEAIANGACLNCDNPLPDGQRWCDHFCLEDWELRRRMSAQ